VATKREVETKLRELIRRLGETQEAQGSLAGSLPDPRIIAVHVTDLEIAYWSEMAQGIMGTLHQGEPERADIVVRASSDHLVEIIDGRRSMATAVLTGQVKVQASLSDLLRLQRLR
jgi:predicted lipid carrier protein YhbT